jgi:hypothetical protein
MLTHENYQLLFNKQKNLTPYELERKLEGFLIFCLFAFNSYLNLHSIANSSGCVDLPSAGITGISSIDLQGSSSTIMANEAAWNELGVMSVVIIDLIKTITIVKHGRKKSDGIKIMQQKTGPYRMYLFFKLAANDRVFAKPRQTDPHQSVH